MGLVAWHALSKHVFGDSCEPALRELVAAGEAAHTVRDHLLQSPVSIAGESRVGQDLGLASRGLVAAGRAADAMRGARRCRAC